MNEIKKKFKDKLREKLSKMRPESKPLNSMPIELIITIVIELLYKEQAELKRACQKYKDHRNSNDYNCDNVNAYKNNVFKKAMEYFHDLDIWESLKEIE